MDRINSIIHNKNYIEYIEKNKLLEVNRKYCKHGIEHALDTARIAYIINLEDKLNFNKTIIYATAILHDIGRWQQYEFGISHEIASSILAKDILKECNFSEDEIKIIREVISEHRDKEASTKDLKGLLAQADKLSRNCFYCEVKDSCNWKMDKQNKTIYF